MNMIVDLLLLDSGYCGLMSLHSCAYPDCTVLIFVNFWGFYCIILLLCVF